MKQALENPIMVSLELPIIEDLLKIIGQAIHNRFSHDDVNALQQTLKQRGQEAIDAHGKTQTEVAG